MTCASSSSPVSSAYYNSSPSTKRAERDPYYGYGAIASVANNVLMSLYPPTGDAIDPTPINHPGRQLPSLIDFVAYALYRTRLPDSIVYSSLLLLTRLKDLYPSAKGTTSSPHRLFLSALMLSSKMSMDDTYSNKSWVIVGQNIFSLTEVNRMERELFGFLNQSCYITKAQLLAWCQDWCEDAEAYEHLEDEDETDEAMERQIEEEDERNYMSAEGYEEDENYDEEDEEEVEGVEGEGVRIYEAQSIAIKAGPDSAQSTPPNQFGSSSNTPTSSTTTSATSCSPPHTPDILVHPKRSSSPSFSDASWKHHHDEAYLIEK